MKKSLVVIVFFFGIILAYAQTETPKDTLKVWKQSGNISLLFNQSAFSNWVAGGQNNIAGNLGINYNFNYLKGNWTWDNRFTAAYGLSKIKGQGSQKTDDRLEFNSLLGKKTTSPWYHSAFLNFKTQLDSGFDKKTEMKTTHFFSPAYLQFGLGMLWKKCDNLKINIAPLATKLTFVHNDFTNIGNVQADIDAFNTAGGYFGVNANQTNRFEFGATIGNYYKFTIMENVIMENIFNVYVNYLEDSKNIDLDYTMNLVMKINKTLSANIAFQAIYDDNAYKGFQVREVLGIGINYGL